MADNPKAYQRGFADGRTSMFNEIVATITEERHSEECLCQPCQVMRVVLDQYLGTIQEILGDESFHAFGNSLAVASGQEPRPFRG